MDGNRVLAGKVVSGSKRAAYFTRLDWVQSQCREKLGFTPYPGTLNLMVQEADLAVLASVKKEEAIELVPENPEFCIAKVIPVSVGPVEGAIIVPAEDVRIHGEKIIEVIAPVKLKDALNVRDGDSVKLLLK